MTDDGIIRFLPKYPNISAKKDNKLNPYNGNFYNTLYNKKEFNYLKLSKTEAVPTQSGNLMNHQEIIARYMSSYTPYNGLLLFHEMGTGKSCSAIGAIEQIRKDGKFKGAIYVASKVLSEKFLHEILYTCTDGRYIPEDLGETEETKERRLRKAVSDYYKLGKNYTYQRFAKRLGKMPPHVIKQIYSNHIIVIDEVHNITEKKEKREKKGGEKIEVYKNIKKLIDNAEGCKVLLLSGTPMRNTVSEIASVMNLILPEKENLPTDSDFISKFFKGDKLTPDGIERLQAAFKGRVSYLKAITSDVRRVFKGESIDDNEHHFKVVKSDMSDFQSDIYNKAAKNEEKDGVHLALRQISCMVFPDGSYGSKGYNTYVKSSNSLSTIPGTKKKIKKSLDDSFKNLFRKNDTEYNLKTLTKYSRKYADTIRIINSSIKDKKLVFIYNDFVAGSGIIIFSLILQIFGFTQVSSSKPPPTDKPTFIILTSKTPNITGLISAFNNDNNSDGSRINVIIGSQTISEGVSFKNIQVEIIQTPWFNYARTDQAIARGYRIGSHKALKKKFPDKEITLDIYQQVSIPITGNPKWTELNMYNTGQRKDIRIKKIERIIRESAFDCQLTYDRNYETNGTNYSRNCDYDVCDYKCKGITNQNSKDLDYSTYNLYYINKKVTQLIIEITKLFQRSFMFSLKEIQLELERPDNDFELITSLESIISNSVPIINKYGFTSYLQESGNSYFLVDSLSTIGRSTLSYYTKYPCVKENLTYDSVISKFHSDSWVPQAIRSMCESVGDIKQHIDRLPINIQELLLESAVIGIIKNDEITEVQLSMAERIVKYFDSNIQKLDENIMMSTLLQIIDGPLKCLDMEDESLSWNDCTTEQIEKYTSKRKDKQEELENLEFYGLINDKNKNFCIRDMREGTKDKKLHQITSGLMCGSYKHWDINYIITFTTDLTTPPNQEIMDILLNGECGDIKENGKTLLKKLTVTWEKIISGLKTKEKKTHKYKFTGLKDKTTEEFLTNAKSLSDFLKNSATRLKNKVKGPSYDERNFIFDGPIFNHILGLERTITFYNMEGCPYCTKAADLLEDEIKNKKVIVKSHLEAPKNVKGFPYFTYGSNVFSGYPPSKVFLFEKLNISDENRDENRDEKWDNMIDRIDLLTIDEMKRLIFFGGMMKREKCLFLCAWYKLNNIIIFSESCGTSSGKIQ